MIKVIEHLNNKGVLYKMGVMCGQTLYITKKYGALEKLIGDARDIEKKCKGDMQCCTFVIQAYTDGFDRFEISCFSQITTPVIGFDAKTEDIVNEIWRDYEVFNKKRSDNNAERKIQKGNRG